MTPMSDALPKLFGELLKQRRETLNLSREQIAKELDVDEVYIKDMELGTIEPTLSQLFECVFHANVNIVSTGW